MVAIKHLIVLLVLGIVLISGCLEIDVQQKIMRNGNSDLNLSIISESPLVLELVKQNLSIHTFGDNVFYEEGKDRFSIFVDDFDPGYSHSNILNLDNDLFDFDIKREFKFPYYYFTYTVTKKSTDKDNSDFEEDEWGEFGELLSKSMFKFNYRVEVFGEITKTNGLKMAPNKVKFEIDFMSNQEQVYFVEFKDLFLKTWIGSLL